MNMCFEEYEFCPSVYNVNVNENSIFIGAFVDDLVLLSKHLATNQEIVNKFRESWEI